MLRQAIFALSLVVAIAPAAGQSEATKSVRAAACKWGDTAAAVGFLADYCPHLDLTPLAASMFDTFWKHPEFQRCKREGQTRMQRNAPQTAEEARVYCAWALQNGGGVVQEVAE
jgi:hypothetical protein